MANRPCGVELVELVELEHGSLVLPFISMQDATQLRGVCRRLLAAVADHQWDDRETLVNHLAFWRLSFPRAVSCAVGKVKISHQNLATLCGLRWITFGANVQLGTLALCAVRASMHVFSAARRLDLWQCRSLELTDSEMQRLPHVRELLGNITYGTDAGIAALERVELLHLIAQGPTRFSDAGLTSLRHIVQLDLMGIQDMGACTRAGFIQLAPTLRRLRLQSIANLHLDDSVFGALSLESLLLDECPLVTLGDAGLAALAPIRELHLIYMPGVSCTDWGIAQLAGIEVLQIYGCSDAVVSDDGVAALSGIRVLQLSNLPNVCVTDDGLMSIAGAQSIDLSGCPQVLIQGWGLSALIGIERLDLSNTGSIIAPEIANWITETGTNLFIDEFDDGFDDAFDDEFDDGVEDEFDDDFEDEFEF